MAATQIDAFAKTLNKTNEWLKAIAQELGHEDRHQAYLALRATLHALRDRLGPEETAHLGAQLPLLIRGIYYEGWKPAWKPLRVRSREEFLEMVRSEYVDDSRDPGEVVEAVFQVLADQITWGEIDKVKHTLPAAIRSLLPD